MEEKSSQDMGAGCLGAGFQSASLLTSVRLQFLAGCFGLGTVGTGVAKGESVQLHHYQVHHRWCRGPCYLGVAEYSRS